MSRRNYQIDSLRGISILLVVLFHFFYRYFQLFAPKQVQNVLHLSNWGSFGVCIFLVITGLYLVDDRNQGKFILPLFKRILRLWPVYLVCITMIYLIESIWPLPGRTQSFTTYLVNTTMLHGFLGHPYIDSAHWYLRTLLAVNIVSILIHRFKLQNKLVAYYAWMAGICLLTFAKRMIPAPSILTKAISGAIALMGGGWVGSVVAGISLMRIQKYTGTPKSLRNWALLFTSFAFIYLMNDAIILVHMIIALLVVWLALREKLWFLQNRPTVYLGFASYSIYLIHQNIGYVVMYYAIKHLGIHHYIAAFAALVSTILLGFGIYLFFERPCAYLAGIAFQKTQSAKKTES